MRADGRKMKKKIAIFTLMAMVSGMLAGCQSNLPPKNESAGTTAAQTESTKESASVLPETSEELPVSGNMKTGIALIGSAEDSKDAGEKDGAAQVDTLIAAVIVDADGRIVNCMIDSVQAVMNFSKDGKLVTPADTVFASKNELGDAYGMKKASGIGKEWNEQAESFAQYCIGKTADEVNGIAVTDGYAADADLAASVTISIGDFQKAVTKAVGNAVESGASAEDKLGIGSSVNMSASKDAAAGEDGLCESYGTFAAVTFGADDKITSCVIDSLLGDVNYDVTGKITSDIKAEIKTKNELGDAYGMKKASSIGKEWYEQAAAFAAYTVGKTADEVKGIAVTEGKAADADLAASVTISIGVFQEIVEKAAGFAR